MRIIGEFKSFAIRGNVIDMAVGIVIGMAFGKIVASFVNDVVMPPLGLLVSEEHFADLSFTLRQAEGDAPAVLLNYGALLQSMVDFLVIALAIFFVIRAMNRLKRKERAQEPPAPPEPSAEERLLAEIRDLLRART